MLWFCDLSDNDAEVIATSCKNLKTLHLRSCDFRMTDEGVVHFVQNCRSLEDVYLSPCRQLTSRSVAVVGESCRQLRSLGAYGMRDLHDQVLIDVVSKAPRLESLYLGDTSITDNSIVVIANSCSKLKRLDLWECLA